VTSYMTILRINLLLEQGCCGLHVQKLLCSLKKSFENREGPGAMYHGGEVMESVTSAKYLPSIQALRVPSTSQCRISSMRRVWTKRVLLRILVV
jgi:hypothetical protein